MIHTHLSIPDLNGLRENNCETYNLFIRKDITMTNTPTKLDEVTEKWCDLSFKDKFSIVSAGFAFVLGWVLVFLGFYAEPIGSVSPSVISIFGASLTYVSGIIGLSIKFQNDLAKFKTSIEKEITKKK